MNKQITVIAAGLALAFTGLSAQETRPNYAELVKDVRSIEDKEARKNAAISLAEDYGPELILLLESGQEMNPNQTQILLWYSGLVPFRAADPELVTKLAESLALIKGPRSRIVLYAAKMHLLSDSLVEKYVDENILNPVGTLKLLRKWYKWTDKTLGESVLAGYIKSSVGQGFAFGAWVKSFKQHRATLPTGEQIALTQKEKDGLIAVPNRSAAQDKWLTEVSADLMALSLDQ